MQPRTFVGWIAVAGLLGYGCPSTAPAQQCRFNDECDPPLVCSAGYCRSPCAQDRDCPASSLCVPYRTESVRLCVHSGSAPVCVEGECAAPLACVAGLCAGACASDPDCASLHHTARCGDGGRCVIPGLVLSAACDGGLRTCDDRCVDIQSDDAHCGACGNVCGVGQRCRLGRCERVADAR